MSRGHGPRFPFRLHDLFGPALPDVSEFLSVLRDLHSAGAANRGDAAALMASCVCGFLNRALFHDWEVIGGTPREAADRYGDGDIAMMVGCRDLGAIPYFIFGDSHSRLYQHPGLSFDDGWLLPISITCSGGSARGLINPASNLRYGERLRRFYNRIGPHVAAGTACFFKFGQVDLEYLFPHRWAQGGVAAFAEDEFTCYAEETIERYVGYLEALIPSALRARTFICSISLPAVADDGWHNVCADGLLAFTQSSPEEAQALRNRLKALDVPDIRLRSRLHRAFNTRLKAAAEAAGFPFVDDTRLFWDDEAQKVAGAYTTGGAGRDVHMDRSAVTLARIAPLIRDLAKAP